MSPKPFTVSLFCLEHVFVQTKSDSQAGTETPTGGAWGGEEGDHTYRYNDPIRVTPALRWAAM